MYSNAKVYTLLDYQRKLINQYQIRQQQSSTPQLQIARILKQKNRQKTDFKGRKNIPLKPTVPLLQEMQDSFEIQTKGSNKQRPKSLENVKMLSNDQAESLVQCMKVTQKRIFALEELIADDNYHMISRGYMEERFPAPVQFFRREVYENGLVEFRVDRLRLQTLNFENDFFFTTLEDGKVIELKLRDRNQVVKNEGYHKQMSGLIKRMKTRDTKGNIRKLITELELFDKKFQRKSTISLYKIKKYTEEETEHQEQQQQEQDMKVQMSLLNSQSAGSLLVTPNTLELEQQPVLSYQQMLKLKMEQHRLEEIKKKEQEAMDLKRKHFKGLTTFVNAYRQKLTHSSTSISVAAAQAAIGMSQRLADHERDGMSLKEMNLISQRSGQDQQQHKDPNEIKFDFDEFMKIYDFQKNFKSNFKEEFKSKVLPDKKHHHQNKSQSAIVTISKPIDQGSSLIIQKREFQSNIPKPTKEQKYIEDISPKRRPQSAYSKGIIHEHKRLRKKSSEINQSLDASKSLIEDRRKRQREKEDEEEIASQLKLIKQQNYRYFTAGLKGTPNNQDGTHIPLMAHDGSVQQMQQMNESTTSHGGPIPITIMPPQESDEEIDIPAVVLNSGSYQSNLIARKQRPRTSCSHAAFPNPSHIKDMEKLNNSELNNGQSKKI